MAGNYTLVLTGELLPGFAPQAAWPQLAAYFRMEPEKLAQLAARAPCIIKQDSDPDKLQAMQAGMAKAGARAQICAPDERPALYVLIDDVPRGPAPRALVEQCVRQGAWADTLAVAEVGSHEWKPFRELPASAPPPPAAAPAPVAARAAPMAPDDGRPPAARPGGGDGDAWDVLPEGGAIYAGFWRRFAAAVLDSLILLIPSLILGRLPLHTLSLTVLWWLYCALLESSAWQATPGKRALGVKVVDARGRRIGFGRASGRFFGKFISWLILSVGFMMAGWTGRKQALHDMMAGSFVVLGEVQPAHPLPTQRPPMPWYGWALNVVAFLAVPLGMGGMATQVAQPFYQSVAPGFQLGVAIAETAPVRAEVASSQNCRTGSRALPASPFAGLVQEVEVKADPAGGCAVGLTFGEGKGVAQALRGQKIDFTQGKGGRWVCSLPPNLPNKIYLQPCNDAVNRNQRRF